MKIRLFSDLHLEFSKGKFKIDKLPTDAESVLVLAGDIGTGTSALELIRVWCKQFKYVIYTPGNHEFYGHAREDVLSDLKSEMLDHANYFFLDNGSIVLDDVSFFGSTFWTPAEIPEGYDRWYVEKNMNDFRMIYRTNDKTGKVVRIDIDTYYYWFKNSIESCNRWMNNGWQGKRVIVSHHAPSEKSSESRFIGTKLQPMYFYDAPRFIDRLEKVDLIVHGHMHNSSDYTLLDEIPSPRVVANPYGYEGYEVNPNFNQNLVIEL